ncbi:FG-GAP repeat domain-containing protein [Streptomyces sp. NPDC059909]|uniref:FG-GAP repeat domain-containing protein n=1 Tax=Streptomyces sp. NPDC059909 TaxID=3346998 RepID=UPI003646A768
MAHLPGRRGRRALTRLATAAITTLLAGSIGAPHALATPSAGPAPASSPSSASSAVAAAPTSGTVPPQAPQFPLTAVDGPGDVHVYWPDGRGGLKPREFVLGGWQTHRAATHVDHDRDGLAEGAYGQRADGRLFYVTEAGERLLEGRWGQYDQLLSPGDLGGTPEAEVVARDPRGVLWLFSARADATLRPRIEVGPGWNAYTQIAGLGDLTGDLAPDVVARDRTGMLWLYEGTGDLEKPFSRRVGIGWGWNRYNLLTSIGDLDRDGHSDLLARDRAGALWLHKGTGRAEAPFAHRTRVGDSAHWNQYRLLF